MISHPLKGTCNDESCPLYGLCHCCCGEWARISEWYSGRNAQKKGQPMMYLFHHNPRQNMRTGLTHDVLVKAGKSAHRGDLARDARIMACVDFLHQRYGNDRKVSQATGIAESTLYWIRTGRSRTVHPRTVRRLVEATLVHKKAYVQPWEAIDSDVVRRLPSEKERREPRDGEFCGTQRGYDIHRRAGETPCERCRSAHNQRVARYKTPVEEPTPEGCPLPAWRKHGTYSAYTNGCRCEAAREANRDRTRAIRKQKAQVNAIFTVGPQWVSVS